MASSSAVGKLSREEFRRQKDLDAARKAGTAPAALDEEGKPINPHIPQYISQAPWYLDTGAPSLSHQRRPTDDRSSNKLDQWYERGAQSGVAAKKYRKGACENCGAMTHKRQDCLERPRKKGAKYTNKNIARDEVIQNIEAGYDAKRDRWNGYDPAEHKRIYEEYEAVEMERQRLREEEIDKQTTTDMAAVRKVAKAGKTEGKEGDPDFGSSDEEDADEDKYADAADAVGQKMDTKTRITVRNLRIREDTAKYLINLDPSSAYYDPKHAPCGRLHAHEAKFAGDNFLRYSGEAPEVQELQLFAWQSEARGNDVHLNANPTQGQLLHEAYKEKKEELRDTSKVSVLAKYGGEEHLAKPPKELLLGQTEEYVEYSRAGQVIHGKERAKTRSKYPKMVLYVNNHTSVWGSWYETASSSWGYGCCHSTVHISYCTGEAGKQAAKASSAQNLLMGSGPPPEDSTSKSPPGGGDKGKQRKTDVDVEAEQGKLSDERKRRARANEGDERFSKKSKNEEAVESKKFDVSEDELEYRREKGRMEDPMANYVDGGDL
ncbi:pre-mRNA-splicing factor SLU7 [Russula aff. rugulosa BPL654]|nr:pre-mRNA-splicing factor SLU7 [Russula aff. rugulosa BPL654]